MRIDIRTFLRQVCNKSEYTWTAIQSINLAIWKTKFASHSWAHAQIWLERILVNSEEEKCLRYYPNIQAWI